MRISDWSSDVCSSDLCAVIIDLRPSIAADELTILANQFAQLGRDADHVWMVAEASLIEDFAEVRALRVSQGIKALGGLVDGFIPLAATDVLSRLCLIEPTLPLLRAGLNHLLHDRFLRDRKSKRLNSRP